MQAFNFHIPTRIVFGRGTIARLNQEIPASAKKIMIVTDHGLNTQTEIVPRIKSLLKGRKIHVFDAIDENPTLQSVAQGAEALEAFQADYVLGIGGGSAMDAAKGVANRVRNPKPILCIPTTAGTGSEVTPFAVFTDPENETKVGFSDVNYFPRCSVIDPELTVTMPEQVALNTGLDSLAHAAEAYLSMESFELNDQLALQSIKLVVAHLQKAITKDQESVDKMSYSAMLSGITITHASTILPHIMGYPLTVYHQVPHGRAGIILLPALLDYLEQKNSCPEKIDVLRSVFKSEGGLRHFLGRLGVSLHLKDYGVEEQELENYVKKVIVKGDVNITPGSINEETILYLYKQSL